MVGRCQRGVGFPLVRWQLQCKGAFRTSLDIRECVSVNHVSLRHPLYLFTRLLLGKSAVRNISLWTILLVPSSKSCCTVYTVNTNAKHNVSVKTLRLFLLFYCFYSQTTAQPIYSCLYDPFKWSTPIGLTNLYCREKRNWCFLLGVKRCFELTYCSDSFNSFG